MRLYDIRAGRTQSQVISRHHQDKVCGLSQGIDPCLFASGGNEGIVNVWDERKLDKPVWVIESHTSAVRAIAWCPWSPHILATGGGLDDESIQFHNTDTGTWWVV